MREIKFRAWNEVEEKMYNWYDFLNTNMKNTFIASESTAMILMQYTGLKDKNGKEIYEGDILLAPAWFGELKCICIYQQENIVSSIQGFGLYSYDSYFNNYRTLVESDEWDEFKIIGNIYETPELLVDKE